MTPDSPKFPALWIAREGSFDVADEPLSVCNFRALTSGFFLNLAYLDSNGLLWRVERAEPVQPLSWREKLFNRQFGVRLTFGAPIQPDLQEITELLCTCVDRDPGDIYDQFVTHDELKNLLRSARSTEELLQVAQTLGRGSRYERSKE